MSGRENGNGGGPPDHAGPPDDKPGRGPPQHVLDKFQKAKRREDGSVEVSDDPLDQLVDKVDMDNLTPFQELVLAVMDKNDLFDG